MNQYTAGQTDPKMGMAPADLFNESTFHYSVVFYRVLILRLVRFRFPITNICLFVMIDQNFTDKTVDVDFGADIIHFQKLTH